MQEQPAEAYLKVFIISSPLEYASNILTNSSNTGVQKKGGDVAFPMTKLFLPEKSYI